MHESSPAPLADSFAPKPGDFPTPPRQVRMKPMPLFPVAIFTLFIVIGISTIVFWLIPLALSYAAIVIGKTTPGEITNCVESGVKKKRYRVWYTFQAQGVDCDSYLDVDKSTFDGIKVGDPVTVRFLRLCPEISAAIDDARFSHSTNDCCVTLFMLAWNGFVILALTAFVNAGLRRRRLAKFGMPALGKVANKQVSQFKGTRYLVYYRFRSSDGADREGMNEASKEQYDALAIGHPLTILYDPEKPDEHVIYRCGEFEVIGLDNKVL